MAFGRHRRASASGCGARPRAARRGSSSARARRCSCRSPISASSSSTRSTRAPTSRRTASSTTRATWRWCARGSRRRRSCSPPRRPSLETRVNAETGRYRWLRLPARFGARDPARLTTVDLRREGPPRGRWLSPKAIAGVEAARARGEQALLFLNRRGYAPLTLCRACGHRFQCPNCSAWLVEHRFRTALVCHHCGHVEGRPKLCPACHEADTPDRLRPRRRASRRRGGAPVSRHPHARAVVGFSRRDRDAARAARRGGARRIRPHHRHPARRQGPQFSAADPGRRRRRRCRPRQRRSARRRAHVPTAAPGDRARRTRRAAGATRCCRPGSPTIR